MRFNNKGHYIIHRGLANKTFKENSIKAFKFCFKKNYGIETDLHTTLDNKIVCYHDFSLKRFKSKKLIKNLKYKDINKIASKYKMHIPTLNEVIKISKKNYLMLEIKSKFTKKNFSNLIPIIKRLKHYSITSFNETMCFTGKSFFVLVALECSFYFLLFAISRTLYFRSKKLRLNLKKNQKK